MRRPRRCLHFTDTTRIHLTMTWMVFFGFESSVTLSAMRDCLRGCLVTVH